MNDNPLSGLLEAYYKIKAKEEATHREGLDLWFDEVNATADGLRRIETMLASALGPKQTSDTIPLSGIRLIERPSAVNNIAWLKFRGNLIGFWNLDNGEIVYWLPKSL